MNEGSRSEAIGNTNSFRRSKKAAGRRKQIVWTCKAKINHFPRPHKPSLKGRGDRLRWVSRPRRRAGIPTHPDIPPRPPKPSLKGRGDRLRWVSRPRRRAGIPTRRTSPNAPHKPSLKGRGNRLRWVSRPRRRAGIPTRPDISQRTNPPIYAIIHSYNSLSNSLTRRYRENENMDKGRTLPRAEKRR